MNRFVALLGCLILVGTAAARAQTRRWVVDPKTSLAWWQVDPHLNHLWATTCPSDSSWRPGEGRSGGWDINPALKLPKVGYADVSDTTHVPVYPRPAGHVHPDCVEAVQGELSTSDTVTWRDVRAKISVLGAALVTGEDMRDTYMHRVMGAQQYPDINFTLDSVADLTRQGDTLKGFAFGTFQLHGVTKRVRAQVRTYPDAGGMRVLSKFRMPATELLHDFGFSSYALNLGIGTRIWRTLFMGIDAVFRPVEPTSASRAGN
jgi:YceI-like domain